MRRLIEFNTWEENGVYVANGVNLAIVTEGATSEELQANIRDAVTLYFEGDAATTPGWVKTPSLLLISRFPLPCLRGGLKPLSRAELVAILSGYGFALAGDTKHLKFRRSADGVSQPGASRRQPRPDVEGYVAGDFWSCVTACPLRGIAVRLLQEIVSD